MPVNAAWEPVTRYSDYFFTEDAYGQIMKKVAKAFRETGRNLLFKISTKPRPTRESFPEVFLVVSTPSIFKANAALPTVHLLRNIATTVREVSEAGWKEGWMEAVLKSNLDFEEPSAEVYTFSRDKNQPSNALKKISVAAHLFCFAMAFFRKLLGPTGKVHLDAKEKVQDEGRLVSYYQQRYGFQVDETGSYGASTDVFTPMSASIDEVLQRCVVPSDREGA